MQAIFFCLSLIFFPPALSLASSQRQFFPPQKFQNHEIDVEIFADGSDYDPTNLTYINNLLGKSAFFGNWTSLGQPLANEFTQTEGFLYMHYEADEDFAFGFEIFDGQYMDQKVLTVLYNHLPNQVTSQDSSNATLKFNASIVEYQVGETYGELDSTSSIDSKVCTVITTVYLINTLTGEPFVITGNMTYDMSILGVQFIAQGSQCAIDFATSVLTNQNSLFAAQGLAYFILVLLIGVTQCVICYFLTKVVLKKEGYGRRISPWSLLILNAFDLYFLLATAYFFMSYVPFYELAAVPYAFLCFLYEPKLVWRLFQIHGRRLDDRRRSRLEIQSYFGMLLLFLCLLVSLVVYPNFVYFLVAIYLVPQIKQNYNSSQKHRWNFWITFGLGFPKLFYTVYSKLDPMNLLRTTPNPAIVFSFIGLLIIQFLILFVQRKKPRFGFEERPDYKVYVSKRSAKSSQELCSICLEKLRSSNASDTQSFLNDPKKAKMMILTPCKHEFHLICLTQWLKAKLECPYCRSELPILPEEDDDDEDV